uniref:Spore protein YkvP/CgeB glycosyl transferase-like domain-containing protein n=1 Tax=Desulfovibrio sp. U5L TaxID=596152 RepID=I2PY75_9BACT
MAALPPPPPYAATALPGPDGVLADVRLTVGGRTWHLAGRGGGQAERDRALAAMAVVAAGPGGGLPVFVGAGLGAGIRAVRQTYAGPIFVCDREAAIDAATGLRAALAEDAGIHFFDDPDPAKAAARVADAAREASFAALAVIAHPVYPRLDPGWYGGVTAGLRGYAAFRDRVAYPKFASGQAPARVLLLSRPYFLYREIEAALTRLGLPWRRVATGDGETGEEGVVADILGAVADFRPDFALSVNHLGLDREGRLTDLFASLGLPLASWFVDSPRLILHDYAALASARTMVFSYDADALPAVKDLGFVHTAWLPLATDPDRFRPLAGAAGPHPWRARASFVGASMVPQADKALEKLAPYPLLTAHLPEAAADFAASPEKSAHAFLAAHPACAGPFAALPTAEARLDAELALTWEATRRYRLACVRGLLPFSPLVAGDAAWETALPGAGRDWRRLPELHYYDELPGFYPRTDVNLNCTSLQMKGAVNQRVFDVPAAGGFVLTDAREQLAALFDPGREMAVYADPAEIPDMVRHYLAHPDARARLTQAGRARVLAEHTYDRRLIRLVAAMKKAFGG